MANKVLLCISSTPSMLDSVTCYMNEYEDVICYEDDPADIGEKYMIDTVNEKRVE